MNSDSGSDWDSTSVAPPFADNKAIDNNTKQGYPEWCHNHCFYF